MNEKQDAPMSYKETLIKLSEKIDDMNEELNDISKQLLKIELILGFGEDLPNGLMKRLKDAEKKIVTNDKWRWGLAGAYFLLVLLGALMRLGIF